MDIKEFGQNLWIFCVINTDIHTLEKKKENYEEVKKKNKKTFYYILLLSCWHLLGEISLGEKKYYKKTAIKSKQKWKKSEAYLKKEIPRLFIHYCGKMKSIIVKKKTSSNSYLM